MSNEEIDELIRTIDVDGNGEIDSGELHALIRDAVEERKREQERLIADAEQHPSTFHLPLRHPVAAAAAAADAAGGKVFLADAASSAEIVADRHDLVKAFGGFEDGKT